MSLFDIVNWLGQFGPWVSLAVITLGFFLWKDWRRESAAGPRGEIGAATEGSYLAACGPVRGSHRSEYARDESALRK